MGTVPLSPAGRKSLALSGDGHASSSALHRRLSGMGERLEAAVRSSAQQGDVQSAEAAGTQMSHLTYSRCTPFAL